VGPEAEIVNKRIHIVCRNVGFEGTANGFWALQLDFADKKTLDQALRTLRQGLKNPLEQSVVLVNEEANRSDSIPASTHRTASRRPGVYPGRDAALRAFRGEIDDVGCRMGRCHLKAHPFR
jgi:hypothetical protein